MITLRNTIVLLIIGTTLSCNTTKNSSQTVPTENNLVVDGKLWSSLFQQKAAEYNALCYQAYNIAQIKISEALAKKSDKPLAIITDIDETVLDNSAYAVHIALQGKDYSSNSWYEWTKKADATPLPGSLDFFKDVASKGIEIFYITNRDEKERAATLANLKKFNYPFSDDSHLILRQTTSSKEARRQSVASKFNTVLLLGDNLSDFSILWDKKAVDERNKNVADNASMFGNTFIVLPNFNYGGWEDAIYGNQYNLTPAQKDSVIKDNLKSY